MYEIFIYLLIGLGRRPGPYVRRGDFEEPLEPLSTLCVTGLSSPHGFRRLSLLKYAIWPFRPQLDWGLKWLHFGPNVQPRMGVALQVAPKLFFPPCVPSVWKPKVGGLPRHSPPVKGLTYPGWVFDSHHDGFRWPNMTKSRSDLPGGVFPGRLLDAVF